jgi:hypothetical protein
MEEEPEPARELLAPVGSHPASGRSGHLSSSSTIPGSLSWLSRVPAALGSLGLGLGWRRTLEHRRRWTLECSVGAQAMPN